MFGMQGLYSFSSSLMRHIIQLPQLSSELFNGTLTQQKKYIQTSLVKYCLQERSGSYFKASEKSVFKMKMRDKISEDYVLIYKAPMELTLRVAYPCFIFCTLTAPTILIVDLYKNGKLSFEKKAYNMYFLNPNVEVVCFIGALLLFAIAGVSVIFRYPFRVYKHNTKNEYVAIFLSVLPGLLRQFRFRKASKTTFKNPLHLIMNDCHYFIDKKKAFLMSQYFRTAADLYKLEHAA